MTSSLQNAIEGVYDAFRDVPRPATIDGCRCCLDDKDVRTLISKPLRDLAPDDLTHYASSVFLTVGSVEDYLYFLPRILEILASEPGWWPDPEVVARAIHTAGFHSWPEYRRQTLLRYLDEIISELLAMKGSGFELDSWICAIGRLHVDLNPYLARIGLSKARLIEFYDVNSESLIGDRLANGFWDNAPTERKQVVDWFRSPEMRKVIEAHYGSA